MMDKEDKERGPVPEDEGGTREKLTISLELPPPKVLLTRKAFQLSMYVAWAAAPVTFVALLIYSMTDLPDLWGFHFSARSIKDPLLILVLVCGLLGFMLARIVYKIPVGNPERKMVPDVLAYHPTNLWEVGRTSLALLYVAMALAVTYLGQLLIFIIILGILSK